MPKKRVRNNRDPERERFWRLKIKRWRESGKSQKQFCVEEKLNTNTFSSWKQVLQQRDSESQVAAMVGGIDHGEVVEEKELASGVTFMRFAVEGEDGGALRAKELKQPIARGVAAELIDAATGRCVRIFDGADPTAVSILLAAFKSLS